MSESTTAQMTRCLQRMNENDGEARAELLAYARRRLQLLSDRMFVRFPVLHSVEHSDDLFQEAIFRLWKSLEAVGPTTVAAFMGLAALQMRRALCDLVRKHLGRDKRTAMPQTNSIAINGSVHFAAITHKDGATNSPEELMCWSEFHEAAERLSEPDRTAFDLLYYHELPPSEVALLMDVSERQVRRYWQSARRSLLRMLNGSWPKM